MNRVRSLWTKFLERTKELRGLLELELSTSYRFPLIEFVFSILLFFTVTIALSFSTSLLYFELNPPPDAFWDGEIILRQVEGFLTPEAFMVSQPALSLYMGLTFVAPLFVAFVMVRSFSSGTIKTLLSYPISRMRLFFSKILTILLILATSVFVLMIIGVWIQNPTLTGFYVVPPLFLAIMVNTLLITAVTTFLAILTKSVIGAGAGGVFVNIYFQLTTNAEQPDIVECLSNPVIGMYNYLTRDAPTYLEISTALFLLSLLSIVLILLSWKTFELVEVR